MSLRLNVFLLALDDVVVAGAAARRRRRRSHNFAQSLAGGRVLSLPRNCDATETSLCSGQCSLPYICLPTTSVTRTPQRRGGEGREQTRDATHPKNPLQIRGLHLTAAMAHN